MAINGPGPEIPGGIAGAIGALIAGAVMFVWNWIRNRPAQAVSDTANMATQQVIEQLRQEVQRLSERCAALEQELRVHQRHADAMEKAMRDAGLPVPGWPRKEP